MSDKKNIDIDFRVESKDDPKAFYTAPVEYDAEDVYESFQDPEKCEDLIRMLCNSGMLATILAECASFVADQDYDNMFYNNNK